MAKGTEGNTVITLLADQTITNVMVGHTYAQDITIDLNGQAITADVSEKVLDSFIVGVFTTTGGSFTQSALDNTNALLFAPNMKKVG